MKKSPLLSAIALSLGVLSASSANASSFTMSMVVDNDFAVFTGTTTSINHLLYQNNVVWNSQIAQLSTLNFNLAAGDNILYILAMGGGGQENISGTVNGVNIVNMSVSESSNINSFLSGYNFGTVTNGSYNAQLSDVQTAFAQATWSAPVLNFTDIVINAAGFGAGYHFDNTTAHLFQFTAADANIHVPEPTGFALMGLGLLGLAATRRRKTV